MSTELAKPAAGLPAHLQKHIDPSAYDEFSGGVTSGFPVISYRGRTWRVRTGGEEQNYVNEDGEAMQSIDIVLLKSNELPSKVFYPNKYVEGDSGPPACWSADGIRPDSGVAEPVSPACQTCPNNVWGSRITESGQKTRACSDVRRIAVAFKYQLEEFEAGERSVDDIDVLLLRIPPATLNPLKDYVEKVLKPKSVTPWMLVTKVGFDIEVAYPKLTFKGLRFLSEAEYEVALKLREGEDAKRILNEALENSTSEGTTGDGGEVSGANAQAPAEATTPAPSESKLKPVEEEELAFSEETEDIAPAPKRAAAVEADAEETEDIAPSPEAPKKKASKKKAAKTKPVKEESGDDFDAMLDSILGDE